MFKISEIAPAIAAEMEAHARHAETCAGCDRCRAAAPTPEPPKRALADVLRSRALGTIPTAFADARLDAPWLAQLVGSEAMEQAWNNLTAKRAALIGPPGAGKTSLAVAMFRAAVETAPQGVARYRYVSSHALAKARATSSLGEEAPLVERALQAPLLLLDELGGEDSRHASAVAEVLYERHAENLATWITTGVNPQAVANRYGGGIARRVFEGAAVFRLGGKR
jgi:DNA replication protein DnaC